MRRQLTIALAAACLGALALCAPAQAAHPAEGNFGGYGFDVSSANAEGTIATQAGSHPFAMDTQVGLNLDDEDEIEGWLKDVIVTQVPGLVADTTAYPRCETIDFLRVDPANGLNSCPLNTTVGISGNGVGSLGSWFSAPVFNLEPPPGALLRIGFRALVINVVIDIGVGTEAPYLPIATSLNSPQLVNIFAVKVQLWGDPSDPAHDELRGPCGSFTVDGLGEGLDVFDFEGHGKSCPVTPRPRPFLTLPTSCAQPLASSYEMSSWEGEADSGSVLTHNALGEPRPFSGCETLGFQPSIEARPSSAAAQSPTGLDFSLHVADEGLTSIGGRAQSQIEKVITTLPEGMTANPSLAEGLQACSEADIERETLAAAPGQGCPQAAKIGTVEVDSPLVEQTVRGSLFLATPYENPFDSLLALYIVLKDKQLGLRIVQPLEIEPDPRTGQLRTIAEDIPQLPFSHFRLRFREGGRSPLITPPTCGAHTTEALLYPRAGGPPVRSSSAFELIAGPAGAPCPAGGAPPFAPGFQAGSHNNAAGAHSPFSLRLTRRDGDQDLVRFDAELSPGVVAKLAGVQRCSDAQIALAKAKSGRAELAAPSCPPGSAIGRIQSGAGVGSQLTYVPGTAYLAGPLGGAPLSVVGVVPAVAGPFDVGTVVVRQALRIDPRTAEVTVDGALSDPIPHILAGIPLSVRDIQVHIDRPGFTLNPTSCDPFATAAEIWGGGADLFSLADDSPVARTARYQAADCARLGFAPRLGLRLKGGARRGANPALRGVYRPRPGHANLRRLVLRLPRSAFLDQGHIRTICTRVQYAANGGNGGGCPKAAIYGRARAFTPLLAEPLEGPVYLRSSNNNLPDFVASLRGIVNVEAVARIDSKGGGIRATFAALPDAPLSRVVVSMQGGRKGLIVNSTNLCSAKHRADARLLGQSAKRRRLRPVVRPSCKRKARRSAHRRGGGASIGEAQGQG